MARTPAEPLANEDKAHRVDEDDAARVCTVALRAALIQFDHEFGQTYL